MKERQGDKRAWAGHDPAGSRAVSIVGTQPSGHRDVRTLLKAAEAELSPVTPVGNTRKCLHTHGLGNSTWIYVKLEPEPPASQLLGNVKSNTF